MSRADRIPALEVRPGIDGGPHRVEMGPDFAADLTGARAAGPVARLVSEADLWRLAGCESLLADRGRKHPTKALAPMLLGCQAIPLVRGGYRSAGQALRSVRTLLGNAARVGDANVYLIAVAPGPFRDLLARAGPPHDPEGPDPAEGPPVGRGALAALLPQLPVPDTVRERFLGESADAHLVRQLIVRAAEHDYPVLILGDTGTGKEVVARLLHDQGARRLQTFTAVNCGAIPRELFEAELFGYEKGAHSTAVARKLGLWRVAHRGTLFLDEIAELSLDHQVKILRALEDGEIRPVGAESTVKVDARIVAATNRDLAGMVRRGHFREDLYHRLRVFMIPTPALRDHPEDVPLLASHFWQGITNDPDAHLPPAILRELARYRWPGNARELRRVLATLHMLFEGTTLGARHLRAVFAFEGQTGRAESLAEVDDLQLHRAECLRHLRRADEVLRAAQVPLRDLMRGRSDAGPVADGLAATIAARVEELELLCDRPVMFHGEEAYAIVRRIKEKLRHFVETLRSDPPGALAYWKGELEPDFGLALSIVFSEVDRLLPGPEAAS